MQIDRLWRNSRYVDIISFLHLSVFEGKNSRKNSGTPVMQASYIVNIISRVNAGLSLPLRGSLLLLARAHTCTGLAFDLPHSFERANLHSSWGLMSCNSACTCAGRRTPERARARARTRASANALVYARTRNTHSWETSKNPLSIELAR